MTPDARRQLAGYGARGVIQRYFGCELSANSFLVETQWLWSNLLRRFTMESLCFAAHRRRNRGLPTNSGCKRHVKAVVVHLRKTQS
jgi:hypothetical protein